MDDNDLIFSYSRKEAIEDGTLVDITAIAGTCGFRLNTCITEAIYNTLCNKTVNCEGIDKNIRYMLREVYAFIQANKHKQSDRLDVPLRLPGSEKERDVLRVVVGPGDDEKPVLTICYQGEE